MPDDDSEDRTTIEQVCTYLMELGGWSEIDGDGDEAGIINSHIAQLVLPLRALLAEARDDAYNFADGVVFVPDLGACAYLRNGPPSTCSFGCETEPACHTDHPREGWLWQRVDEAIGPREEEPDA